MMISNDGDEHSMEVNNPMSSYVKEFVEISSTFKYEQKPSCTSDSSLARSNNILPKTLK